MILTAYPAWEPPARKYTQQRPDGRDLPKTQGHWFVGEALRCARCDWDWFRHRDHPRPCPDDRPVPRDGKGAAARAIERKRKRLR